jgi:hypothetical protein
MQRLFIGSHLYSVCKKRTKIVFYFGKFRNKPDNSYICRNFGIS